MNKKLALLISITSSLGAVFLCQYYINFLFPLAGEIKNYLSLAVLSILSVSLSLYIESKKQKPDLSSIASSLVLNFVGVGVGIYIILTESHKK